MERLETNDLFKGASLLCEGARLTEIYRSGKQVHFLLEGENLTELEFAYRLGQIRVNPLQLKETLNVLKDVIFESKPVPLAG